MNKRESYLAEIGEALGRRDLTIIVERFEEAAVPFWIRRDGADLLLQSADEEFIIAVFNSLFVPLAKVKEGGTLPLLQHWLCKGVENGSRLRLECVFRSLFLLGTTPDASEETFDVALSVLSVWAQKPKSLAGWTKLGRIASQFLAAHYRTAPVRLVDPRLLRAVLWSGDLSLMRAFAEIGARHASTPEQQAMVNYLLGELVTFTDRIMLRPLAETMYAANSRNPTAVHNLALVYHAEGRSVETIADLYNFIDEQANPNQFRNTVNWIAQHCYSEGLKDKAASFFAMLPPAPNGNTPRGMSWPQKILQARSSGTPFSVRPQTEYSLLDLEGLAPALSQPLEQAAELARGCKSWKSVMPADCLEREFRRITEHIGASCRPATFTLADCLRATQRMIYLSRKYFAPYQHYDNVSPVPLAERYGKIDAERLRVSYVGLMSIASTVAAIGLESILAGAPLPRVTDCSRLLDWFVTSSLASGMYDEVPGIVTRFEAAAPTREFALRLRELYLLAKGEVDAIPALLSEVDRERSTVHAVIDRETWTRSEGLTWYDFAEDGESTGEFEVVWPDGSLSRYDHVVPHVCLARAHHSSLSLRRGEVIYGRSGAILRPRPFHFPFFFPSRTPDIMAVREKGVRVLNLGPPVEIAEPTTVLENFDALTHRNYYHWVVLLLSRISYLKVLGLLRERRLLVPEGLPEWMHASLSAAGITADDMMVAPLDKVVHLTDAVLISSVEFASPTLLKSLRAQVLQRCGLPEEPRHRYLYLSRRNQTRRPFLNENEIEEIARSLGFTIVQPETLDFTAQAQLFQGAAGVAAPEGAALTNVIFCEPGVRILGISSENDLFPTFNDLAATMGHLHRKLAGTAELDDYGVNYIWSPYRINVELAERHLRWVLGTEA